MKRRLSGFSISRPTQFHTYTLHHIQISNHTIGNIKTNASSVRKPQQIGVSASLRMRIRLIYYQLFSKLPITQTYPQPIQSLYSDNSPKQIINTSFSTKASCRLLWSLLDFSEGRASYYYISGTSRIYIYIWCTAFVFSHHRLSVGKCVAALAVCRRYGYLCSRELFHCV